MRPIPSNWAQGSPMSVEDIAKDASIYDYNPVVPLKYWLRSAASLAKEVHRACDDTALDRLTNRRQRYISMKAMSNKLIFSSSDILTLF